MAEQKTKATELQWLFNTVAAVRKKPIRWAKRDKLRVSRKHRMRCAHATAAAAVWGCLEQPTASEKEKTLVVGRQAGVKQMH